MVAKVLKLLTLNHTTPEAQPRPTLPLPPKKEQQHQCADVNFTYLCSEKSPGSHILFFMSFSVSGSGRLPSYFSGVVYIAIFGFFQTIYKVCYKSLVNCKIDTCGIMKSVI